MLGSMNSLFLFGIRKNWVAKSVGIVRMRTQAMEFSFFSIRKNCLSSRKSLLPYKFTRRVIQLTVVMREEYHCCQLHTKLYQISFSQG
jgi:hypothetical protein